MRAFTLESFDKPASLIELPTPEATQPNQIKVKVSAASINALDSYVAMGGLKGMMDHEFPVIVGRDYAGTVEAVGSAVTRFSPGDEVFGTIPGMVIHNGTFAQYVVVDDDPSITAKPSNVDFGEAAALGLAANTAILSIEATAPTSGETVLVVGASGGVGSVAVQLAKATGARVIATGSSADAEFLKGLGADDIVDYKDDVAAQVRKVTDSVDVVLDFASNAESFAPIGSLLSAGGRAASPVNAIDTEALAAQNIKGTNIYAAADPTAIQRVAAAIQAGTLRAPVQQTFKLDEIDSAFDTFRNQHTTGKIVIAVD